MFDQVLLVIVRADRDQRPICSRACRVPPGLGLSCHPLLFECGRTGSGEHARRRAKSTIHAIVVPVIFLPPCGRDPQRAQGTVDYGFGLNRPGAQVGSAGARDIATPPVAPFVLRGQSKYRSERRTTATGLHPASEQPDWVGNHGTWTWYPQRRASCAGASCPIEEKLYSYFKKYRNSWFYSAWCTMTVNASHRQTAPLRSHAAGDTRFQKSSNSRVSKNAMALTTFPFFMRKYQV